MVTSDDMELVGKMAVKGPPDYREQVKSLLATIKAKTVGRLLGDESLECGDLSPFWLSSAAWSGDLFGASELFTQPLASAID